MDRRDLAAEDEFADEVAVAALGGQIDMRGRAFFTPGDFAQPDRLAEMAVGFADHEDGFIRRLPRDRGHRSEEHTSEPQSLMRISYAVLCFKKKHYYHKTLQHK